MGAGYLRVPDPRRYDMPESRPLDRHELRPEDGETTIEVYAASSTHQLHCLAILRTIIIAYENGTVSHFARGTHAHHCLDYCKHFTVQTIPLLTMML